MLGNRARRRLWLRTLVRASGLVAGACGLVFGCATGVEFDDASSTTGQGGFAGGGGMSVCAADCSAIATPPCLKSVCNEGAYQGAVGQCVIVPDEGGSCDDGMFCTVDDTCDENGLCVGGPPNDCGMTPGACKEVSCNEDTDACSEIPSMDGAPCQDPGNLCIKGSSCSNGVCTGGALDDCFFFPVTDDCHEAVCDPADGVCHEQIGNEGEACVDLTDLCTVNKTCASGICQGGQPKSCSQLTMGCVLGVCDPSNGQCTTQNLMNGDPCDDLNFCTSGELCNNGQCTGGTPVTTCVDNDGCCPMNCTPQNDLECNIPMGTARMVNGPLVSVTYHPCGGTGAPGTCTAQAAQSTCTALGKKVVSHASDGTTAVFSLGASASCYWSISYFTVNKNMPPGSCLVGISNLMWSQCCTNTGWHGHTLAFGSANQTFGYVSMNDTGYVSTYPNLQGAKWGCTGLTSAASNDPNCTTQYVACTP